MSAQDWMAVSATSPLSRDDREWVAGTIRATRKHLAYLPACAQALTLRERTRIWVLDLDLTPLGEPAAAFDRNTQLLRQEVPHLSDSDWDAARLEYLRTFWRAPKIFRSATLAARFEEPARRNLARQLGAG